MIESFKQGEYTVEINYDPDPESPAKWDNLGVITYNGRSRYVLGTTGITNDEFDRIKQKIDTGAYIGLPVWAYVHGSSTIKAAESNPFSCPWDSGHTGWVYATREKVLSEFGGPAAKRITKRMKEAALSCLRAEVETFSQYLNGEVYGFVIKDANGNQIDSCWGFYGLDACRDEASNVALNWAEELV